MLESAVIESVCHAPDLPNRDHESDKGGDQQPGTALDRQQNAGPKNDSHPDPNCKSVKQFHETDVSGLRPGFNSGFAGSGVRVGRDGEQPISNHLQPTTHHPQTMTFAVLQFPASNCDQDAIHALRDVLGHSARYVWHKEQSLGNADAVVVPGGFSYGDYLRCGAIARFSPVMQAVQEFAANGGLVLGICNGFQVLCEAGLLPGALIRNRSLQFRCEHIYLKTLTNESPFTNRIPPEKLLRIPIAHGEGCYFADDATLNKLKAENRILWQYCNAMGEVTEAANPNGSLWNIAGICNERRNVAGLMPHPERACEPLLGSADGCLIFESFIFALQATIAATAA